MKRVLPAKKLKKLFQAKNTAGIQQLARLIHPARVAEALTNFSAQHVCEILALIAAQTRAGIFCYLPPALQIETVEFFGRKTLIETIAHLPADRRADFCYLPPVL